MENKTPHTFRLDMVSPCTKNWDKMTPTEKGRFCKSCKKEVINLVGLDEKELNNKLFQQPNNFCGRIEAKQLNSINPIPKRNWFNRAAASILITLGLAGLFTKQSNAQVIDVSKMSEDSLQKLGIKEIPNNQTKNSLKIEGTLKDKVTGEGIPFANIVITSNGIALGGAQSDYNGKFAFKIPDSTEKLIDIKISYLGYEPLEIKNLNSNNLNLLLSLKMYTSHLMAGVLIINKPSMIDPSNTSTGSTFNEDGIENMAIPK